MVRRRFRVDRCEAERRVRAASGLRLVCGSSMVWPHLLHTSASVRRMPRQTHIMAHIRDAPHTAHRAMQRPHCPESPRHPRRPPPGTLCPAHTFGARKGVLETVAAVRARRRHVSHLVTGPGSRHGLGASLGYDRCGSPRWLSAGVMSVLPRWHTQRSGRCPNSR